jgi:hypothetical protein
VSNTSFLPEALKELPASLLLGERLSQDVPRVQRQDRIELGQRGFPLSLRRAEERSNRG